MNKHIIEELWQEHCATRFPSGFSGKNIDGIDFVMLDADIAGCVSTFLTTGTITSHHLAKLGLCYRNAGYVLRIINEEGREYFGRLEQMAELVLKEIARTQP